jgi:ectonucleoside triphosphate diphosphohydrolase 4
MQSVPAWIYEAMTIGAFGMAIVVFVMGIVVVLVGTTRIMRGFVVRSLGEFVAAIGLCAAAIILGGGLIWLGLHYGFEFHERLLARNLVSRPPESLACNTAEAKYGLIIDAGSSGSRIYIYCFRPAAANANGIPWVTAARAQVGERPWFKDGAPPIAEVESEKDAETVLEPLIEFAKAKIGKDPQTLARTPLHLMATGGVRKKGEKERDKIKQHVKTYLMRTFPSATAEVIEGKDEALYGWKPYAAASGKINML